MGLYKTSVRCEECGTGMHVYVWEHCPVTGDVCGDLICPLCGSEDAGDVSPDLIGREIFDQ